MAQSRGAGAAKKGFDYKIFKKGGKVGCYAEGGHVEAKEMAEDKKQDAAMIHKHERGMHPGKPLTKFSKGGTARGMGRTTRGGDYKIY